MAYNLIEERWIPVRRQSGKSERIAPWQIAERKDPPIRVESPRPDFDAALLEMLIGLVQTVMTPKDETEWREIYKAGIDAETLHEKMRTVKDAFFLDGDGPRFSQDLDVHKHPKADRKPIGSLLIERGTAADAALFAKTGGFEQLGLPMVAAALLTIQQFAPPGGAGVRTSLRGGGPLSTTLKDSTLWTTCWCNVLNREDLSQIPGDRKKLAPKDTFPWMSKTRTSENSASTLPTDIHPLQHFWGLPRRYRLCLDDGHLGTCAISGEEGPVTVEVWSRPHGTSYGGPFRHPLTAYTVNLKTQDPPNPKKGGSGMSYRDWPLMHLGGDAQIPPAVVEAFYRNERWKVAKVSTVVARGYAMDNMKPLRFFEAETPLLHVAADALPELRADTSRLVEASEKVRRDLLGHVKSAWSDRPADLPGDPQMRTDVAFWSASESDFYRALRGIATALENDREFEIEGVKTSYLEALQNRALTVFDTLCPLDADLGADELGRIVRARRKLESFTSPRMLATTVGLAKPEPKLGKRSKIGDVQRTAKKGKEGIK